MTLRGKKLLRDQMSSMEEAETSRVAWRFRPGPLERTLSNLLRCLQAMYSAPGSQPCKLSPTLLQTLLM